MTGREIINKVIEFDSPPRIGMDFNLPHQKDIAWIMSARLQKPGYDQYSEWGFYKEILKKVPGFMGKVCLDCFGNVYGRLEGKTKGECIKGALQDGWDKLESYKMPEYDIAYEDELKERFKQNEGRFILGALPVGIFSTIRDLRRIDNMLVDLLLEEDMVAELLDKVEELSVKLIIKASEVGFDGVVVYDDWGTQNALMISPDLWRKKFKPIYKKVIKEAHDRKMKFFLHSCGHIYEIIEDFIEVGVDVFQFDQPELAGVEKLSENFGGRVTFWCPVDIQKIIATGEKELIQEEARKMIRCFGKFSGGFIAKDYPTWDDINIKDEWAQWARDVFTSEGSY